MNDTSLVVTETEKINVLIFAILVLLMGKLQSQYIVQGWSLEGNNTQCRNVVIFMA